MYNGFQTTTVLYLKFPLLLVLAKLELCFQQEKGCSHTLDINQPEQKLVVAATVEATSLKQKSVS